MSRLADLTWTDVAGSPPLLLVPVGSCEQHGPHLPLDTDTRIATAIADRCAALVTGASVTPPIAIGASGEHGGFAGTLSVGTEVLTSILIEVGRSADWAGGVVFVNGHGGNVEGLRAAVATLTAEGRRSLAWWPRIAAGDAHAGRTETSLLLALAPSAVRLDRAEAGNTQTLQALMPSLRSGGIAAVSANGVLGDPTGASAAEGHDLVERLVYDLVDAVLAWRAG